MPLQRGRTAICDRQTVGDETPRKLYLFYSQKPLLGERVMNLRVSLDYADKAAVAAALREPEQKVSDLRSASRHTFSSVDLKLGNIRRPHVHAKEERQGMAILPRYTHTGNPGRCQPPVWRGNTPSGREGSPCFRSPGLSVSSGPAGGSSKG